MEAYIQALENDPEWLEVENRPWANLQYRVESSHCRGNDFVLHNPRVFFRFFWNERLRRLSGSVHWNKDTEGPPTGAHGASIMLVYDEILAYPVWRSGVTAFTVNMNVNLRKVIPLESTLRFDAWIDKVDKRKVFLKGSITTFDLQTVHSDASGLWVISNGLSSIGNCWKEIIEKDNYRFEQKKIRILGDHFPRSDAVFSSTKPSLVPSGALVSASPPAITLSSPSSTSSSSFPSVKPSLTLATPSGNFHMHTAFRSCL